MYAGKQPYILAYLPQTYKVVKYCYLNIWCIITNSFTNQIIKNEMIRKIHDLQYNEFQRLHFVCNSNLHNEYKNITVSVSTTPCSTSSTMQLTTVHYCILHVNIPISSPLHSYYQLQSTVFRLYTNMSAKLFMLLYCSQNPPIAQGQLMTLVTQHPHNR